MLKKNPDERISLKEIINHPWVSQDISIPNITEESTNQEVLNSLENLGFSKNEVIKDLREGNHYPTTVSFEILKRSIITEILKEKSLNRHPIQIVRSMNNKVTNVKLPSFNMTKPRHRLSAPVVRRLSTNELRDTSKGSANFSLLLNLPRNNIRKTQFSTCSLTRCD